MSKDLWTGLWCSVFCFHFTDKWCFLQPASWQGIANSDLIYRTRAHSCWWFHQPVGRHLLFHCCQQSSHLFLPQQTLNMLNSVSALMALHLSSRVSSFVVDMAAGGKRGLAGRLVMYFIIVLCNVCFGAVYKVEPHELEPFCKINVACWFIEHGIFSFLNRWRKTIEIQYSFTRMLCKIVSKWNNGEMKYVKEKKKKSLVSYKEWILNCVLKDHQHQINFKVL